MRLMAGDFVHGEFAISFQTTVAEKRWLILRYSRSAVQRDLTFCDHR